MLCSVFDCKNKWVEKSHISFHCFPKDPKRAALWLRNLNMVEFKPKKYSRICSEHFTPGCFNRTLSFVRLRENVEPTIRRPFPLSPEEEASRTLSKCKAPKESSSIKKPKSSNSLEHLHVPLLEEFNIVKVDHSYCLPSAELIKQKLQMQTDNIVELWTQTEKNRRNSNIMSKRLNEFGDIFKDSKFQGLMSEEARAVLDTMSDMPKELDEGNHSPPPEQDIPKPQYPPELRAFALTLSLYSSNAYEFARDIYDLDLPSLSVIQNWYSSIENESEAPTDSKDPLEI
eukprot:TRINITY_DN6641_c0_g1_i1.p1 TRINITY_DN6641_c0_g1~~TRINITY_DN6641_c0_g1_i1.p1  ORF type:complete len:286 (-),score=30.06 TRINITY_DN6641_c0_g1_i1:1062-1919(-)